MSYYECKECCYGTNSPRKLDDHQFHTGHFRYTEYEDDE